MALTRASRFCATANIHTIINAVLIFAIQRINVREGHIGIKREPSDLRRACGRGRVHYPVLLDSLFALYTAVEGCLEVGKRDETE